MLRRRGTGRRVLPQVQEVRGCGRKSAPVVRCVYELPENVKRLQDMYVTIQRAIAEYNLQYKSGSVYSVYLEHTLRYSGYPDIHVEIFKGEEV